jgi:DNA-binding NarL/FixJ family response regulator
MNLCSQDIMDNAQYKLVASTYRFTKREAEVLMLMQFGLSIDEIADNLCRSRKTIFCHLVSCQRKANSKTLFHLGSLVVQITM